MHAHITIPRQTTPTGHREWFAYVLDADAPAYTLIAAGSHADYRTAEREASRANITYAQQHGAHITSTTITAHHPEDAAT